MTTAEFVRYKIVDPPGPPGTYKVRIVLTVHRYRESEWMGTDFYLLHV